MDQSQRSKTSFVTAKDFDISAKGSQRHYEYTKLRDLQPNTKVNIYAVVKFFKPPDKSRGTDYCLFLSLVDQSLDSENDKLKCTLFARQKDALPKVEHVGDIIRIHRLQIKEFRGELQGQNSPGISCLVFDKEPGGSLTPRTSSSSFTLTQQDTDKIESLRNWVCNSADLSQDIADPEVPTTSTEAKRLRINTTCISAIRPGAYVDLLCQVVASCVLVPDKSVLLRVWDGTEPQCSFHQENTDVEPLQCRMVTNQRLKRKALGYMVDVWVFDNHTSKTNNIKNDYLEDIYVPQPGDFVKFTNLHANRPKDKAQHRTELTLHGGTVYGKNIQLLRPDSVEVLQLNLLLDELDTDEDEASSNDENITADIHTANVHDTAGTSSRQNKTNSRKLHNKHHQSDEDNDEVPSLSHTGHGAVFNITHELEQSMICSDEREHSFSHTSMMSQDGQGSEDHRCMLRTATITSGHQHQAFTAIKVVLSHSLPYKFRIRARVADFQPRASSASQFCRLFCQDCNFLSYVPEKSSDSTDANPRDVWAESLHKTVRGIPYYKCPRCNFHDEPQGSEDPILLQYVYMLQLLLVDDGAWVAAGLWNKDAIHFFHDHEPTELLQDLDKFKYIYRCLEGICPRPGRDMDQRPLVECCIKAFSTGDGPRYQIFDTMLAMEDSQDV